MRICQGPVRLIERHRVRTLPWHPVRDCYWKADTQVASIAQQHEPVTMCCCGVFATYYL